MLSLADRPVQGLDAGLDAMNSLISHRGPDGSGTWRHESGRVGLTHRRLEIIDLHTGAQPMQGESGDWITYNGEIYNYIELRDELGASSFRTTSDTEVILRAYEKWGTGALTHLRGMFAFALWDERRGTLFCARDRFGMKPFYYAVVDDACRPTTRRELDGEVLDDARDVSGAARVLDVEEDRAPARGERALRRRREHAIREDGLHVGSGQIRRQRRLRQRFSDGLLRWRGGRVGQGRPPGSRRRRLRATRAAFRRFFPRWHAHPPFSRVLTHGIPGGVPHRA